MLSRLGWSSLTAIGTSWRILGYEGYSSRLDYRLGSELTSFDLLMFGLFLLDRDCQVHPLTGGLKIGAI